jgi:hypothetical protein
VAQARAEAIFSTFSAKMDKMAKIEAYFVPLGKNMNIQGFGFFPQKLVD